MSQNGDYRLYQRMGIDVVPKTAGFKAGAIFTLFAMKDGSPVVRAVCPGRYPREQWVICEAALLTACCHVSQVYSLSF
ncbi:hypothetical protein QUF31_03485 [Dickeya chrysanthemi]|uniref:hypothetical protein n=1 Tax=Dickeya chrysanthemi TaxID=556 RepID=UPI0025A07235|nr:hypothetical protein [Dickeya chrysanthemi]WJM86196.1 hypothetical protein QUF31_03485 [Dickeya chrysanthemi]